MSDIGVKNSREDMGFSNFECRTDFYGRNPKKNAQRRLSL